VKWQDSVDLEGDLVFSLTMIHLLPRCAAVVAILLVFPSCQTIQFYGQAMGGQWQIVQRARPNPQVIADPKTSAELRKQLIVVEGIRQFASDHLFLPGEESYGRYADLGRQHVVWVVYAAKEFSLEPKTWFYPAVGSMNYRGYFREKDAEALAASLRVEGYDVCIGGVDAYSTLGWFHDPVLNTFVGYPDVDLAETIFHELTHRKVFRAGDTVFNESLANTVAEEGVRRWLRAGERWTDLKRYETRLVRRRQFYQEIDRTREQLRSLYHPGRSAAEMRREKAATLEKLRGQFRELRRKWGGRGLEYWLEEPINNGHIVSLDLYYLQMPAFQKLLADCDGDLEAFFRRVERFDLKNGSNE
jgi:predicted aminopeptidase